MSITVIAETTTAPTTKKRPTLRQDLDAAVLRHAFTAARIRAYTENPALDSDGGPLPLPMRFRIAHRTSVKRLDAARAAYAARYER